MYPDGNATAIAVRPAIGPIVVSGRRFGKSISSAASGAGNQLVERRLAHYSTVGKRNEQRDRTKLRRLRRKKPDRRSFRYGMRPTPTFTSVSKTRTAGPIKYAAPDSSEFDDQPSARDEDLYR